jgi:hypothetical protein
MEWWLWVGLGVLVLFTLSVCALEAYMAYRYPMTYLHLRRGIESPPERRP